ncbi:TPA: flagellar basal body-associated FliL family protein [Candidatus Poribacteria bacterium]|nr:flagellar basal body-associated FliL family protein [Candidatus Poribacteria bacterium]HEX28597.1 flagellar basal body-associated FliL family protein [Candidatus Poribacteria bacterium]
MAREERIEGKGEKNGGSGMLKNLIPYLGTLIALTAIAYIMVTRFMPEPPSSASIQRGTVQRKKAETEENGVLYEFGDVIANPAQTEGTRFLKVTIYLELRKGEYQKIVDKYKPKLQDVTLQILSSKTVEELEDVSKRGDLRKEITDAMNSVLGRKVVLKVFFTEFVIQ